MDEPWKHAEWKTQKATYCTIPLIWKIHTRPIHEESRAVVSRAWEEGTEYVLDKMVVMDAQLCEYPKYTELYTLKG